MRYSVQRTGTAYEVYDADAAGAQVSFSSSRKAARHMSRELNCKADTEKNRADQWKGGFPGDFG